MSTLYTPALSPDADAVEIEAEISWVEQLIDQLDTNSVTYTVDLAFYEDSITKLVNRWNQLQEKNSYNGGHQGTGFAPPPLPASPGLSGGSASPYMGGSHSAQSSPAEPTQPFARKRSLGMLAGIDRDSKRPSLTASPALTPGTPASVNLPSPAFRGDSRSHLPDYFGQGTPQNQQRAPPTPLTFPFRTHSNANGSSTYSLNAPVAHWHTPQTLGPNQLPIYQFGNTGQSIPSIKAEPQPMASNIIDLTQDGVPNDSNMMTFDPFPELAQAYQGDGTSYQSPANAFDQDFMNTEALAELLLTPAPPGTLYGVDLGPNSTSLAPNANLQHQSLPPVNALLNLAGGFGGLPQVGGQRSLEDELFGDDLSDLPTQAQPEAIAKLIENITPDDETPRELREPTPPAMSCRLMEHQKLGLAWLKKMEAGNNKGGILADDMGLGKTIQALALILARPSNDRTCKTTLIVAPVALMRQWEKEIQRHVHDSHRLKVHVYHGNGKKADFSKLRTFDVVLTTFGTLASEMKQCESRRESELAQRERQDPNYVRPVKDKLALIGSECMWYRIIIDEAQCIKNKSTLVSKAAAELMARHRLCMTGTPMMNSINELFPLLRFLRIKPYNDYMSFSAHITKPIKDTRSRDRGMKRLQGLLKSIMLRRQKSTVIDGEQICKIPPKHEHRQSVEFSHDEHELYQAIQTQTQVKFNKYLKRGTVNNNYAYILVLLLRLRQACCHPHLIKDLGVQAATEGIAEEELIRRARELRMEVVNRLKTFDNFECPICLDGAPNPTVFIPCGHTCCGDCFQRLVDPTQAIQEGNAEGGAKCPNCREKLSSEKITDYKHFCKVHDPERATQLYPNVKDDDDEDGDEGDTDSDSDEDDSANDDDVDSKGNLANFVVSDDEEDDFDPPVPVQASSSSVKQSSKKNKGKVKGKGKARAQPKMTLAQLKKESLRNAAAKKKYLRRLRKGFKSSSKIDKAIELVSRIRANDPTEKILIFSQFTSLLDLMEVPLEQRGLKYQRYDGSMKMDDRAEAVNKFMDEPDQQIMLISLKAGNAGLNLNKASQVIIMDPFWNPFIEEQAVDRAHRMPQRREVHVHRVLVPKTVEDRICELQERKREIIQAALDEGAGKSISRLSVRDLMFLFGLSGRPN